MRSLNDKYKGVNIALQNLKHENIILSNSNKKLAEALERVESWIDDFSCTCTHDFICPRCAVSNRIHNTLKEYKENP